MRLAWRIAPGPNRAPGRFEVPRSKGMPAMHIAASAFECSRPRKLDRMAKVGVEAMKAEKCLDPLEYRGDSLAEADAHRDQRVSAAGALQLAGGGQRDAGTRGA